MVPAHGIMKAFPKVKRVKVSQEAETLPLKKKKKKKKEEEATGAPGSTFRGLNVYILPAGIGNARCHIFQTHIQHHGGQTATSLSQTVTHVVVDDNMDCDRALRLLGVECAPPGVQLVKCSWLSLCISEKRLVETDSYSLLSTRRTENDVPKEDLQNVTDVPDVGSEKIKAETIPEEKMNEPDEDAVSQNHLEALLTGLNPTEGGPHTGPGKWVCAQSSLSKSNNFNKDITDKLEVLEKAYTHQGDKWRALGYAKAVNALKSYHKAVTSYQSKPKPRSRCTSSSLKDDEACQIPGIGKRMADKIDEIMESGHLRKLDHIGEAVPVLELFTNIWGAGAKTAQLWYQQGFRTLDDIRTKAHLTHTQKVGLQHYQDFLERMPRAEAAAIEKVVREAALAVDPGLLAMACGSYRRGKATCGDVDVLITHPDGKSHKGVFSKVLQRLHQTGFLTDDLVSHEENGEQKKYMGVCRLPGAEIHRRLDIIVVPYAEFSCALMYFTGSAHFNRSMRALAKTKGMSLSEHSLNQDVVRHGSTKVHNGTPLNTMTEKDVFSLLGIPFRRPHERDW